MLSPDLLDRLETLQPEIAEKLDAMVRLAPETTDRPLLELCAGYVDAALRRETWNPPARPLSEKEQAFIELTEQFVSSVGTMTDQQVKRLLDYASADEVYAFVNALYVTDMAGRLEMVAGRIL
jgi:hypothetical protein